MLLNGILASASSDQRQSNIACGWCQPVVPTQARSSILVVTTSNEDRQRRTIGCGVHASCIKLNRSSGSLRTAQGCDSQCCSPMRIRSTEDSRKIIITASTTICDSCESTRTARGHWCRYRPCCVRHVALTQVVRKVLTCPSLTFSVVEERSAVLPPSGLVSPLMHLSTNAPCRPQLYPAWHTVSH